MHNQKHTPQMFKKPCLSDLKYPPLFPFHFTSVIYGIFSTTNVFPYGEQIHMTGCLWGRVGFKSPKYY